MSIKSIHQEIPWSQPLQFVSYFDMKTSTMSSMGVQSGIALSVLGKRNENDIYKQVTHHLFRLPNVFEGDITLIKIIFLRTACLCHVILPVSCGSSNFEITTILSPFSWEKLFNCTVQIKKLKVIIVEVELYPSVHFEKGNIPRRTEVFQHQMCLQIDPVTQITVLRPSRITGTFMTSCNAKKKYWAIL